jgi:predicted secreted protein
VGQIFQIESPSQNETWQVDYDPVLFEPLTPPEEIQSPGPAGWRFKAVVPGEGQIVLVSIVECANPPCPLMPIRFQINFKVK